jgi:hypothetical protein
MSKYGLHVNDACIDLYKPVFEVLKEGRHQIAHTVRERTSAA